MSLTAENTPAYIVKMYPQASDLFKENKIDFCCGGDVSLKNQFEKNNLDGKAILAELNESYDRWQKDGNEAKDWDAVPIDELVDHITYHHHEYLKQELPALGEFVTKIFRVHGTDHPHLKELHKVFNEFKTEMEEHTIKEDTEVFPLIKEYEKNPSEELLEKIRIANGGLEDDHDAVGELLKRMREITNDFTPPADACNSYRITYARLAEMEADTFQHIHLENNVLFKNLA